MNHISSWCAFLFVVLIRWVCMFTHFYSLWYVFDLINGKKNMPIRAFASLVLPAVTLIVSFCYCLQLLLAKPKWNQSLRVKCVHRNWRPKSYTIAVFDYISVCVNKRLPGEKKQKKKEHIKKKKEWNECAQFYMVALGAN